MAANGYFQVVAEEGKMWLKVFPPEEGGEMVALKSVMKSPFFEMVISL